MQKIKVRKDIYKQITSKLKSDDKHEKSADNTEKMPENDIFNTDFAEKVQNKQVTSKLQTNKNIFSRGDFDDYKISDEELKAHYGQTADGQIYDLTDPTEKFYYDLKRKFDEADKEEDVEKSGWSNANKHPEKRQAKNGKTYTKWINNTKDIHYRTINSGKTKINNGIPQYIEDVSGKKLIELLEVYKKRQSKHLKNQINDVIKREKWVKVSTKKGNTISYDNSKNVKMEDVPIKRELLQAKILVDRGLEVFLPSEPSKVKGKKNIDAIVNGVWVEFKYVDIANRRTTSNEYLEKLQKCPNVFIYISKNSKDSAQSCMNAIQGRAEQTSFKTGILIIYDERSQRLIVRDFHNIKNNGRPKILKPSGAKEAYSNLDNSTISQQNNLSSKNVIKSLTYSGHKLQGRKRLYGMDISIENKKGSYRSGVDKDGHKWRCYMNYDYGYIRGTEGVDSDQVDVYIGNDKDAQKVYVIHQNDPVTHKYDEDKCMLCFSSAADAKKAYMKQYDRPGFYGSMTTMTIDEFKSFVFSHQGKRIHKSFDIQITDITENNKQQKLEQFNKALNAIAKNQPFVIKHIPADKSESYGNITVRLLDFDRSKIEKAVHKVALSLDADISGASKGESFVYKSQEEIVDKYFKEFTNRTRAVYNFVISYFDLPDIRIVSKAGELKHKGKILYNPSTGIPIKESDWKKFVVELEKFLNRNYTGVGEKIVLSAESLGIILDRLSKTNSLEAIRKMSLSEIKAKRYDVDWISESIKNMKDEFGEVISRERQARIQIAIDSAAQRVVKVKDDMRNNIQQIIIDGIRDKQSKSVVAQNLFDKCASLNRDMQRIADTEVQMAATRGYLKEEVYNTPKDEKVYFKRFEMIDDNTCKKCKKINGKIVLWSDVPLPDEHIRDEFADIAIWEGKTEGEYPESCCHPWCRGTWVRYYPEVESV